MKQHGSEPTVVLNLMDGREKVFPLDAEMAVIAAFEQERENFDPASYQRPEGHPNFRVHRLGYSCGDWIAYRQAV